MEEPLLISLRRLLGALPIPVLVVDRVGTIRAANQRLARLLGYADGELEGSPLDVLIPDEARARHPTLMEGYFRAPEAREMAMGRELRGICKDGRSVPLEIALNPIELPEGLVVMCAVVDISERKHHEALLSRNNAQLAQLNEDLSQFAYSASHDLKSPLATMNGLLRYAVRDILAGESEKAIEVIERVRVMTDELGAKVGDILRLARADMEEAIWGPVDLCAMIERIRARHGEALAENDVLLEIRSLPTNHIPGDETRLEQIIENLIANGIKYSDPAEDARWVAVEVDGDDERLRIRVSDNGLGIPEAHHREVFQMFKRFHEGSVKGTGLGLALIRRAVSRLGGSISFESNSKGTCFAVDLPIEAPVRPET